MIAMDYTSAFCCLLAFGLYCNSLNGKFVYDDRRAILGNPDLDPRTHWKDLFFNDYWGTPLNQSGSIRSYRPLSVLTFRLNYYIGEFEPFGYHLVNVFLHSVASLLMVSFSRQLLPDCKKNVGTWVSGLMFATHPVHTEAVASVVGRAELLSCVFFFLSFLSFALHVKERNSYYFTYESPIKKKVLKPQVSYSRVCCNKLMKLQQVAKHKKLPATQKCMRNYVKMWAYLAACLLLAVAALLSKETGITVLAVCFVYDLVMTNWQTQKQHRTLFILLSATAAILYLRMQAGIPEFSRADNPTAKETSSSLRLYTFSFLPALNFGLLVFPNYLSFDWGMDAIPIVKTFYEMRIILAGLFYIGLISMLVRSITAMLEFKKNVPIKIKIQPVEENKNDDDNSCLICNADSPSLHSVNCRNKPYRKQNYVTKACVCTLPSNRLAREFLNSGGVIVLCLAFLAIPFLPATNMFYYVGFVVAERVLYMPSIGYCLLMGFISAYIWNNLAFLRKMLILFVGLVIVSFCFKTVLRNRDWQDEQSLYQSAIPINPAKAYGNLGAIWSDQGRVAEAEWAYKRALHHKPGMADVYYNLGRLYQQQQRYEEAVENYRLAITLRRNLAMAYVNLGTSLLKLDKVEEGLRILNSVKHLNGKGLKDFRQHERSKVAAQIQIGKYYKDNGNYTIALDIFKAATNNLPSFYSPEELLDLVADTLVLLNRPVEAAKWYKSALDFKPTDVDAHIQYGKFIVRHLNNTEASERWFNTTRELAPTHPACYYIYGEFLVMQGEYNKAAEMYIIAADLKPKDHELAMTVAMTMREAGRYDDSESWYRRALEINPINSDNLSNLGAILQLKGKFREAARFYRRSLRIQPDDHITSSNLERVLTLIT